MVDYFQEIQQLKSLLDEVHPDINKLVGEETSVLVSARRGMSIGSTVVKNGQLCELCDGTRVMASQKCGARKCKSCDLLGNMGESISVNGREVTVRKNLN